MPRAGLPPCSSGPPADEGARVPEKLPPADGQFVPLLRVIIVDDHPSFRAMAARLLIKGGFSVVGEEADGATALSSAQELRPDLVLLDVQLPDIDGFQVADALVAVARAVQAMPPGVVLMSSRASADYGPRVAAAPVLGFIAKADLSGPAIRRLLSGRMNADPPHCPVCE
jgi:DNA-binding NarL/FixJ family response regulator